MRKLLLVSTAFAISAFGASYKGAISESGCGAKHADGGPAAEKCVAGCVKKGAAPVFVTEGKVLKIKDSSKVMNHLGKKVEVEGAVDGDTIDISDIKNL